MLQILNTCITFVNACKRDAGFWEGSLPPPCRCAVYVHMSYGVLPSVTVHRRRRLGSPGPCGAVVTVVGRPRSSRLAQMDARTNHRCRAVLREQTKSKKICGVCLQLGGDASHLETARQELIMLGPTLLAAVTHRMDAGLHACTPCPPTCAASGRRLAAVSYVQHQAATAAAPACGTCVRLCSQCVRWLLTRQARSAVLCSYKHVWGPLQGKGARCGCGGSSCAALCVWALSVPFSLGGVPCPSVR